MEQGSNTIMHLRIQMLTHLQVTTVLSAVRQLAVTHTECLVAGSVAFVSATQIRYDQGAPAREIFSRWYDREL